MPPSQSTCGRYYFGGAIAVEIVHVIVRADEILQRLHIVLGRLRRGRVAVEPFCGCVKQYHSGPVTFLRGVIFVDDDVVASDQIPEFYYFGELLLLF